jgi:hypothetical protein
MGRWIFALLLLAAGEVLSQECPLKNQMPLSKPVGRCWTGLRVVCSRFPRRAPCEPLALLDNKLKHREIVSEVRARPSGYSVKSAARLAEAALRRTFAALLPRPAPGDTHLLRAARNRILLRATTS